MTATYLRFEGEIVGVGTASGHRLVIGRWTRSPLGAFADVMHESPTGHRTLFAPDADVAELVRTTYEFDEVRTGAVAVDRTADRIRVTTGDLHIVAALGRRTALGLVLRAVPAPIARSRLWASAIDPFARLVLDGVRTRGSAGNGREEWYGATDQHRVDRAFVRLDGAELGDLADVWPPVRFGFSSTPRAPSVTSVTTTIRL